MANLIAAVYVNGKVFRPGDELPADVAKLLTNPKLWDEADEPEFVEPESGEVDPDGYASWKLDQLRAEVELRVERGSDITPEGKNKADLVAALVADDAK